MNKILKSIFAINLAFFILAFSFFITISIRSTYKLTIPSIKQYGYTLSNETINKNYNILMDYLADKKIKTLTFDTLPMSNEGRIHFVDVKNIFLLFLYSLPITLVLLLISLFLGKKKNDLSFIKSGLLLTLLIPLVVGIPMLINFDKTFIVFHRLLFSNDYWMFDPYVDPIIDYLPESLFFFNGMLIIFLVIIFMIIFSIIYRKNSSNKRSN